MRNMNYSSLIFQALRLDLAWFWFFLSYVWVPGEEVEERIKGKSGRCWSPGSCLVLPLVLCVVHGRLRVVTIGKEDRGYIATLVADKKEAKWMRKHLDARQHWAMAAKNKMLGIETQNSQKSQNDWCSGYVDNSSNQKQGVTNNTICHIYIYIWLYIYNDIYIYMLFCFWLDMVGFICCGQTI